MPYTLTNTRHLGFGAVALAVSYTERSPTSAAEELNHAAWSIAVQSGRTPDDAQAIASRYSASLNL